MVEITADTEIGILEQYVSDSEVFYVFNYTTCLPELYVIKGFNVDYDKRDKILNLKVNNLGNPEETISLNRDGKGIFKEKLVMFNSMVEMVNNFDKKFLERIKNAKVVGTPNEIGAERETVGVLIRFRETILPSWVQKYPSIAI